MKIDNAKAILEFVKRIDKKSIYFFQFKNSRFDTVNVLNYMFMVIILHASLRFSYKYFGCYLR
jgi:hypothetical protein